MEPTIRCVYASLAASSFDPAQLPVLLEKSRARNATRDLTGMLLYLDGNFFQVLEGPAGAVDSLFEVISRDPRHSRITRIIREPIARRDFGDWTMGFESIGLDAVDRLLGTNDFFGARSCVEQLNPGRARKLLDSFARGRWKAAETGMHRAHARLD